VSATDPLGLVHPALVAAGVGAAGGTFGSVVGAALAGERGWSLVEAGAKGFVAGGISGLTAQAQGWSIVGAALMDMSINAAFITSDLVDHVGRTRARGERRDGTKGHREMQPKPPEISRVRAPPLQCVRPQP
jgi:hypothetical protein